MRSSREATATAACPPEPEQARGDHDERKRQSEYEQREKGGGCNGARDRAAQCTPAHTQHGFDDQRHHRRFEAEKDPGYERHVAKRHIDDRQHQDGQRTRHDEQRTSHEAAARTVQQPPDVRRELLSLGPGQQRAVIQRVQEPLFADPPLLVDDQLVHQRNLSRWTAKAEEADLEPYPRGFAKRHRVAGHPCVHPLGPPILRR